MEFFGINGSELLLILVVGVVLVGPSRAAQGIVWLKNILDNLRRWSAKLREETVAGKEGLKVDLSSFDPRQYDPRSLIKDAVAEEMRLWMQTASDTEKSLDSAVKPLASLDMFAPQLRSLAESKEILVSEEKMEMGCSETESAEISGEPSASVDGLKFGEVASDEEKNV